MNFLIGLFRVLYTMQKYSCGGVIPEKYFLIYDFNLFEKSIKV
jgi:hypothetical protein